MLLNSTNIPKHIAIIMDGNGRFAKQHGKPRSVGHRIGARNIRRIVTLAAEMGIEILTLWAFSTENWKRPQKEINYLMKLLLEGAKNQIKALQENNIQLHVIGDLSRLSEELRDQIEKDQALTANNTGLKLIIALNYSGKWDITQAARQLSQKVCAAQLNPLNIDEKTFSNFLSLSKFPDPDLLIRTGGELRISNFCLWQLAYTEFYFTNTFWPEFDEKAFKRALLSYAKRQRRFGGLD
jgi:undecaprenyl diphosphate synthase